MLRKIEGLDREAATRRLVPSMTTLLGMVKHLAYVEHGWLQSSFMGKSVVRPRSDADPDAEFRVQPDETITDVTGLYRAEIERSRQIVANASLDDHARRADRKDYSREWILVHTIEEPARHTGHADIVRELIDGATGE